MTTFLNILLSQKTSIDCSCAGNLGIKCWHSFSISWSNASIFGQDCHLQVKWRKPSDSSLTTQKLRLGNETKVSSVSGDFKETDDFDY